MSELSTELSIVERVQNGAAWIDEHVPGWAQRIELGRLNMVQSCDCVGGQIFGHFTVLIAKGMLTYAETARLGFFVEPGTGDEWRPYLSMLAEYDLLQTEWVRLIESRRRAVILSA